jgi:hypothetical protein
MKRTTGDSERRRVEVYRLFRVFGAGVESV